MIVVGPTGFNPDEAEHRKITKIDHELGMVALDNPL